MMNLLLLPGYGGKYVSPSFDQNSDPSDSDTLDISRCAQFTVQIIHGSGTPAGSVQLQQTVDGVNWADYGEAIDASTDGAIARFQLTAGPFGKIRIDPTDITDGEMHFEIVGFAVAEVN